MYEFKDYYQNTVQLSFDDQPFSDSPKHVWVICRFGGKWLLTEHEDRGYEFFCALHRLYFPAWKLIASVLMFC